MNKAFTIIAFIFAVSVMISQVSAESEKSVSELHDEAYQLAKSGEFSNAKLIYGQILEKYPHDEKALLNRAVVLSQIGDQEGSLKDFDTVLSFNPNNASALMGKAAISVNFDCISYQNCGPLESARYLEKILENEPDNDDVRSQLNFVLTKIPPIDVRETNGEYKVSTQYVIRDSQGMLVSVTENVFSAIVPAKILENYLDSEIEIGGQVLDVDGDKRYYYLVEHSEKNIVKVDGEEYTRWYFETKLVEPERQFYAKMTVYETWTLQDENKTIALNIINSQMPAVTVDVGDHSTMIFEILKKI